MDDDDDEVKITFMGGTCPESSRLLIEENFLGSIRQRIRDDFSAANRKKFNRLVKSGEIRPLDILNELTA